MSETPISKSQARALRVLNLQSDDSYESAALVLEGELFPRDGVPDNHTWRSAAKLSDAELENLLKQSKRSYEDFDDDKPDGYYNQF